MSDKKLDTEDVMASIGSGVTLASVPAAVGAVIAAPIAVPTLAVMAVGFSAIALGKRWLAKKD